MIPVKDFFKTLTHRKPSVMLFTGLVIILTGIIFFLFITKKKNETIENNSIDWQQRLGIILPPGFNFAGDSLPLNDSSFLAKLKTFLPQNKNVSQQMENVIKRAKQWFPTIEIILKKNNLPEDLKYIAVAESRLTNAVSPRGASGFWQLMNATAQKYGLEINENIDERLSMPKSTQAACSYLKDAHKQLGCWTLAAAGYNLGINGIAKQINKQNTTNYFELNLNAETEAYVFKLIALKYVLENTTEYDINIPNGSTAKPTTRSIVTDSSVVHLHAIANKYSLDVELLKKMNPWMKSEKFNNPEKKTFSFEYPKESSLENFKKILFKNEIKDKDSTTEFRSKS